MVQILKIINKATFKTDLVITILQTYLKLQINIHIYTLTYLEIESTVSKLSRN